MYDMELHPVEKNVAYSISENDFYYSSNGGRTIQRQKAKGLSIGGTTNKIKPSDNQTI